MSGDGGRFGPETMWVVIAAGFAAIFGYKFLIAPNVAREPSAVLRIEEEAGLRNEVITERECRTSAERLWVRLEDQFECIAFVVAQPTSSSSSSGTALVFFNGDVPRPQLSKASSPEYRGSELKRAQAAAEAFGVTTVVMGRPGLMGSTGFHRPGGMREDAYIMNTALDGLREKLSVQRLALAGQSGGARLIAQMMVLKRRDIVCAAMGSGAYDVPQHVDGTRTWTSVWGKARNRYLVPMQDANDIPVLRDQRLFVIGDPNDKIAEFPEQRAWAEKLRSLGHGVVLIEARGEGPSSHGLSDAAVTTAGACLAGKTDADIAARVGRR